MPVRALLELVPSVPRAMLAAAAPLASVTLGHLSVAVSAAPLVTHLRVLVLALLQEASIRAVKAAKIKVVAKVAVKQPLLVVEVVILLLPAPALIRALALPGRMAAKRLVWVLRALAAEPLPATTAGLAAKRLALV
jgi:hypothetical protein